MKDIGKACAEKVVPRTLRHGGTDSYGDLFFFLSMGFILCDMSVANDESLAGSEGRFRAMVGVLGTSRKIIVRVNAGYWSRKGSSPLGSFLSLNLLTLSVQSTPLRSFH